VILGVLSVKKAAYGIYAHTILAGKAGYTMEQVKSMLSGQYPPGITARQEAMYKLAVQLARMKIPLDPDCYNDAVSVLGLEGVAKVTQQVAAFMYAAMILSVGDVKLPPKTDL
jgi:hypothetical protein